MNQDFNNIFDFRKTKPNLVLHPFPKFFQSDFISIHQDSHSVDFGSDENHSQCRNQQNPNGQHQLPYRNIERYSRQHRNRRSEGNHRQPETHRPVWIVHYRDTAIKTKHHR